jgi:hypothetical protein
MKFDHFVSDHAEVIHLPMRRGIAHWLRSDVVWIDAAGVPHRLPLAGYLSDGYSVPSFLWSFIRGIHSYLPAYLHDVQYQIGTPKGLADSNIYHAMRFCGDSVYTCSKVWIGLTVGGWPAYNRHARLRARGVDIVSMRMADNIDDARVKALQEYL